MPEGMNEFLWFILGVFSYRIVAGILQYGQLAVLFEKQLYHILKLLDIMSKDLDNALEIKYSIMKDAGFHDEDIKIAKEIDDKSFKIWKEMTIARIITHWPKLYRKLISFNNWNEAIRYLRDNKNKVVAK
tara:strand:- start:1745 stop:2134 length:390 start_codon:yes stop_codon:yes gene_type:complete